MGYDIHLHDSTIIERYDKTNPRSIEAYAKELIGRSFREIIEDDKDDGFAKTVSGQEDKANKGNLGQVIEEYYFHYKCNGDSRPDFPEAGVELKVTPYKVNSSGKVVAKERLIITMIDYFQVVNEEFERSHLWRKAQKILLIYYKYESQIHDRLDYKIGYSRIFTPPEQDKLIIKHDYELIVDKIKHGKAHELSEADTLYLGAATKASSSKDFRDQPYSSIRAKRRAFSFKNTYMTFVLNNYIINAPNDKEDIMSNGITDSFEDYVIRKIQGYSGWTEDELCECFGIGMKNQKRPKNLWPMIIYRILGVKGNQASEFIKAGIVIKTIQIGPNGKIKESMSFPTFKFKKLVEEEWEASEFREYLADTRFLFVVARKGVDGVSRLKGCQFWNIPYDDLEINVKSVWERTQRVLQEGLRITYDGGHRTTNLPKASENPVCHVRPHGTNAADTDELPDGRAFTKQCFWLNNSYVYSQLRVDLRN